VELVQEQRPPGIYPQLTCEWFVDKKCAERKKKKKVQRKTPGKSLGAA